MVSSRLHFDKCTNFLDEDVDFGAIIINITGEVLVITLLSGILKEIKMHLMIDYIFIANIIMQKYLDHINPTIHHI